MWQDSLHKYSYDVCQCYTALGRAIELFALPRDARILDMEGYLAVLEEVLGEREPVRLNSVGTRHKRHLAAAPDCLPFRDGTFALATCTSLLAETPEAERGAMIAEMHRVTAGYILVNCTFDTPGVAHAENLIVDLGRLLLPKGLPPDIGEETALPDLAATWLALEELGGRAIVVPCANLASSFLFLAARLLAQYVPAGGGVLRRFLPAFNASFTDPSFCHAWYRHMIVFSRGGQLPAPLLDLPHYSRPDDIPVQDDAAVAQIEALHRLVGGVSESLAEFLRRTQGTGGVAAAYMDQLDKAAAQQQTRLARLEQIAGDDTGNGGLGGRIIGRLRRIVGND